MISEPTPVGDANTPKPLPRKTKILIGCGVIMVAFLVIAALVYQLAMKFLGKQIISAILQSETATSSAASPSSSHSP